MYCATAAHAFGGMGSWNDLDFENPDDTKKYEELSFHLYAYIIKGVDDWN